MANISEQAQRVMELVHLISNGSQRHFAKMAGCSHSSIAKIANGLQEPGNQILGRISQIPCVNRVWLETGKGTPLLYLPTEEKYLIPISTALLPGPPSQNKRLLSSSHLALPESIYSPTRYAIQAQNAFERDRMPSTILSEDILIIDTDKQIWHSNLQVLPGRYSVIVIQAQDVKQLRLITLNLAEQRNRKPQLSYISSSPCGQSQTAKPSRPLRHFHLDTDSPDKRHTQPVVDDPHPPTTLISAKQIAGIVIQSIRNW